MGMGELKGEQEVLHHAGCEMPLGVMTPVKREAGEYSPDQLPTDERRNYYPPDMTLEEIEEWGKIADKFYAEAIKFKMNFTETDDLLRKARKKWDAKRGMGRSVQEQEKWDESQERHRPGRLHPLDAKWGARRAAVIVTERCTVSAKDLAESINKAGKTMADLGGVIVSALEKSSRSACVEQRKAQMNRGWLARLFGRKSSE